MNLPYAYDPFAIGPLIIDKVRVYAGVVALIGLCGDVSPSSKYTDTGKAIRACGDNYTGALVVGLNVAAPVRADLPRSVAPASARPARSCC